MNVWIPIGAFGLCVIAHAAALLLFPRIGLLDFPERYGHRRGRIPYPTGILAVVTFLFFFLLLQPTFAAPWSAQALGLMAGITLLAATCFMDDRTRLSPSLRLAVQGTVALIIFLTGTRIYSLTNPFGGIFDLDNTVIPSALFSNPPLLSGIFTILWLGLTMNALNWFDGIPGQVSLLSTIGFLIIGLLSLSERVGQPELALLACILAGIALASFLFDVPPPRVLMGDTGAMFFGLMLGVLTIYAGGKVATAFLVLGVPLIDSVIVIVRRILKGVSPLRGNATDEHLHHRLLRRGWSERRIIVLTALLGGSFGFTALFLSTMEKAVAALAFFIVMVGLSWYSSPPANSIQQ